MYGVFSEITFSLILIPIFWGALFPDIDQIFNSHRNLFFHSIALNLFVWYFNITNGIAVLCVLGVGLHFLCDSVNIKMRKGKWYKKGGYYCIIYFPKKRMSNFWTTTFLRINFLISVFILIIYLIG